MTASRKVIIALLESRDYPSLITLSLSDRKTITKLISLSYDKNDPISWRAMEAIGLASKEIAKTSPDTLRNIAGRLLWMLRDESGGIGWSVPEILGEIVRNNQALCSDFAPIIVSFHEELMLTTGVLWALGRIGNINKETVDYAIPIVRSYLHSPDAAQRGYAALALGEMGDSGSIPMLESLRTDESRIRFYEDGMLKEKSTGEIASAAIEKLSHSVG